MATGGLNFQSSLRSTLVAALERRNRLLEEAEFGFGDDHAIRILDVASGLELWVYRDGASIVGIGNDEMFETIDCDDLDQLAAAVVVHVERLLDDGT